MRKNARAMYFLSVLFLCFTIIASSASAAPVTRKEALATVSGWLELNPAPFGIAAGTIEDIEMYGARGEVRAEKRALYYVVYLDPEGIVFLPADDLVEPVAAYLPHTRTFLAEEGDNVYDIIAASIAEQVKRARRAPAAVRNATAAPEKWRLLRNAKQIENAAHTSFADVRVAPLLRTQWGQDYVGEDEEFYVYNYYTPHNYPAGCTATAMAQIMKYFAYPKTGIGVKTFTVDVNGRERTYRTMGGDGKGGPYAWEEMPEIPDEDTSEQQRAGIGALFHDIGIALASEYTEEGTNSYVGEIAIHLCATFQYADAVGVSVLDGITYEKFIPALNSNLDADLPVALGILPPEGNIGHSLVVDGYAYDCGTMYHHFNMGLDGVDDMWFAFPLADLTKDILIVDEIVYNIYPQGEAGEIVSGRTLDKDGSAIPDATVTLTAAGLRRTARSNEKGIFAFTSLPPNTRFDIAAAKAGRTFAWAAIKTGKSSTTYYAEENDDDHVQMGNVWDLRLQDGKSSDAEEKMRTPQNTLRRQRENLWQKNGDTISGIIAQQKPASFPHKRGIP